jgi:hypothetical protein
MKTINFPVLVARLPFSDYSEGMDGEVVVWTNIPEAKLREHGQIVSEIVSLREETVTNDDIADFAKRIKSLAERRTAWLSDVWSKGAPETHISADDIASIIEHSKDTDPRFFEWLVTATMELIQEHRFGKKKISS